MHALPSYPRSSIAAAAVALLLALALMLAAAPELGTFELSLGGSGSVADTYVPPGGLEATPSSAPAWATEPLAPPLEALGTGT